jgi:hypothetical protein
VTSDRARKQAIRARMAVTGESYATAARILSGISREAASVVTAAAHTLAEPSCRIRFRRDVDVRFSSPALRLLAGAVTSARPAAVTTFLDRYLSDDPDLRHIAGDGFADLAGGRYLVCAGASSLIGLNDDIRGGRPGQLFAELPAAKDADSMEPLWLLRQLPRTTVARLETTQTLHGIPCKVYALDPAVGAEREPELSSLTAWLDGEHIRRIQVVAHVQPRGGNVTFETLLELLDFGADLNGLDWSRLPALP